jgi:hypothetical protein
LSSGNYKNSIIDVKNIISIIIMSNKGRYFTREIDLDTIVRNPLRSHLNANGNTITNLGPPIDQTSVARMSDISGGGGANVWYLYPAFADISLNCNGIQDVSAITFCGRQTYLRQTLATFDISSNRSIRFNNNQLFLQTNGNIGIGKNNPSFTLDVSGSFKSKTILDVDDAVGENGYLLTSTENAYLWSNPAIITVGSSTISLDNRWDNCGNNIYNNNSGNVGIGTNTPIYKLDVSGRTIIRNSLYMNRTDISDVSGIYFSSGSYIKEGSSFDISSNRSIRFNNNQLFLQTNGNIGIGTNTPIYSLDVSGRTIIRNSLYMNRTDISDVSGIYFSSGSYIKEGSSFDISSNRSIRFNNNQLFLQNNGNIGIGTNTPIYRLDVSGRTIIRDSLYMNATDISDVSGIYFRDGTYIGHGNSFDIRSPEVIKFNNNKLVIDTNGNIGVGKTNPSYNLDVSGSFNVGNSLILADTSTNTVQINSNNIKFGASSGSTNQGSYSIAIGYQAAQGFSGAGGQGDNAIAIGYQAGQGITGSIPSGQGVNAIAVGYQAGNRFQGINTVAIGNSAGLASQGQYAVAIGYQAGYSGQSSNSIVLNATEIPLQGDTSGTYIAPLRNISNNKAVYYNTTTKEITYGDISNGGSSGSNQWTTSGLNIYNTNYLTGNVAIGKTIPSYSLDVSGSFKSSRIIDVSNSSGLSGETMISLGNGNGYKWITPVYGSFSSDISQNIDISGGLGYPTAITYNRAEISNLCDFSGSRIYVRRSGIFKFSYSIQMVQTANQSHKVYIYIKQNGVILDRTSSTIMLLKDSEIFPMCEYILPLNKGDYIEVIFYSLGTTVTAVYLLDSTHIPPYFPSAPSIISNIYSLVTYP